MMTDGEIEAYVPRTDLEHKLLAEAKRARAAERFGATASVASAADAYVAALEAVGARYEEKVSGELMTRRADALSSLVDAVDVYRGNVAPAAGSLCGGRSTVVLSSAVCRPEVDPPTNDAATMFAEPAGWMTEERFDELRDLGGPSEETWLETLDELRASRASEAALRYDLGAAQQAERETRGICATLRGEISMLRAQLESARIRR